MTQVEISNIIGSTTLQRISSSEEFYFQKGQDALKKWLSMTINDELKETLIQLSTDYHKFIQVSEVDPKIENIKHLLLEIVSYCDNRAKDKNLYNKYEDKRILAEASVRMGNWVAGLIKFKFEHEVISGPSIVHAFNYLLYPQENCTILSRNHREMIAENLFKRPYLPDQFIQELKEYFEKFDLKVINPDNYTALLSGIIYAIKDQWEDDVIGLMASDSTGWQEHELGLEQKWKGLILWNSKRPTGGAKVLKFLREKIEDGGSFPLYYSVRGNAVYRANIIDFAIDQTELDRLNTPKDLIKHFEPNFSDYHDDKKSARIVFVAESIEKIGPVSVSEFEFYKSDAPRQDNLSPIKTIPEEHISIVPPVINKRNMSAKYPLNQILYGPPGTGKTYSTVRKAIEIVDPGFLGQERTRQELADHFRSLLFDEKKNPNGQIVFTTFHQSLAYEDFIEGIKPNISDDIEVDQESEGEISRSEIDYIIKDGIFKRVVDLAKKSTRSTVEFGELWSGYVNQLRAHAGEKLFTSINSELKLDSVDPKGNAIYVRFKRSYDPNEPEGTRAFIVSKNMIERLYDAKVDGSESNDRGRTDVAKYVGAGRATHIYSVYKDFYLYALVKGAFSSSERLNYVIIIDEINRGNVSSIFGELITLIETDKRIGEVNELTAVLPYSRDRFGVPSNLYIIGTMNTADRSVEALDTALRRRFSFTEMPPKYDLEGLNYHFAGTTGSSILETINKRIRKLLDRDHLIGHSYFLIDNGEDPHEKLMRSFYSNIIPLLQEYFYGDYAKIGAVLGQGFIYSEDEGEEAIFGSGYEELDYNEKQEYFIRDFREQADIKASINGTETKLTFELAVKLLLNT